MSGAFPTTDFNALNLKNNQKTLVSTTDSGKTFRRQIDGQRWSFTVSCPLKTRSNFAPIMAFIVKQRSQKENFTITFPLDALGSETGTVKVNGAHSAGDTTITVDGHAGDTAGSFKAGDLIKFSGHSKVYMIVADVTPSSNASTLTIEPPLTTALSDNETLTYDSIPFTVHLQTDLQEFETNANDKDGNLLFSYEFDVIESI
ncbi:MAG TPA: hypothetical protein DHV22_13035 [Xanthomarina gelatinilytica]|uniref:Uncharacterized protein n=1 Tax=Xanthomarina gelatinilytica TaxID=1137281 RepID=A0A3D6BU06_9FLAO|nr:hypothetical protein [Xanthomarina gelatinilytica]